MRHCWSIAVLLAVSLPGASYSEDAPIIPKVPSTDLTDLSIEDLSQLKVQTVYGASKHEQSTLEAPSAVSIVSRQDIQEFGYRTLSDVLKGVRGFYATFDRQYPYVGVDGFGRPGDFGGRTLVMIDGHRINDPIFDQGFFGNEFPLDADLIDRVEVIRGPGSSLYGNNAFFAVINVVTRRSDQINGAEVSAAVASYEDYRGRVTYGQSFTNGISLTFSGSYLDRGGPGRLYYSEFDQRRSTNSLARNNGIAENNDGETAKSFFLGLSYKDFSIEGGYVDREKHSAAAPYGTLFNDHRYRIFDERAFLDGKYQKELPSEWKVMARVYFDHYRYDAVSPYPYNHEDPPAPGLSTMDFERDIARSLGTEFQVSRLCWDNHLITGGIEFRWDPQLEMENWDVEPSAFWVRTHRDAEIFGAYVQDEYSIRTNLILNAGLRYDWFSLFGNTINPRGAVVYKPWQQGALKLIYGQAYRAPNIYESGYVAPGYHANADLGPETIQKYELVFEQGIGRHAHFATSLFHSQVNDLITQVYDPNADIYYNRNLDRAESRGVEAELEIKLAYGVRGRLSYTYADARDTATDARLSNSPEHLAKFNLVLPVYPERISAGFEVEAMSRRMTVRGNRASGFATANLTLFSHHLLKGFEVSAGVYNLFDVKYSDPVSVDFAQDALRQDGRTFRVKLTYHF